ncbi:hypothetical protein D0859_05249 [Hortaea werneckii]|uniref:Uncharacterized protein n=1 Tax=Hortaea werneckii TaxID=91943 RepID=A0A3M7IYN9_HORWE|nr:hypothetical protein D0859_05249 [Hortaea werneckii]
MSSTSTPAKRVASANGISEKKRAKIEEFGEEWADLLGDSDDENEDRNTDVPANEEVLEGEVNHLRKEAKNKHAKMEVIETPTETPVKTNPQGTTQQGHLNVNDNDDENEDTWENRYYEDAWAYFNQAKIHTKFMKQLDSLDKRICKALTPPSGMVVDTIRHFATKAGHPISSLEEIEEEYYGIGGWKEFAKKLGPSTDYKDYKTTAYNLLDNALRYAEAEPNAIYQQYSDMLNDLLCMREAYRNLRRGFTKYKCLAKSTREEFADRHLASMADKIFDPDNMHGLNDLDYMDSWDSIGALMFFRQCQNLQAFIDQADECASYARDLFAVVDEEANAEADREEEAELQQLPALTQDNLRAFADRQ